MSKVKVAVLGTGSLGQHHARIYTELAAAGAVELTGIYDAHAETARKIAEEWYGELHNIRKALTGFVPRIISEEEREQVRDKLQELSENLKANLASEAEPQPQPNWKSPTDEQVRESLKRMGERLAKQDKEAARYE